MLDICGHAVRKGNADLYTSRAGNRDPRSVVSSKPTLMWTHPISGKEFDGCCLVYGDKVFIKTNNTSIFCLDHATGETLFEIEGAFAKSNIWGFFIIFEDELYAKHKKDGSKVDIYSPTDGSHLREETRTNYWGIVEDKEKTSELNAYLRKIPRDWKCLYSSADIHLSNRFPLLTDQSGSAVMLFDRDTQEEKFTIHSPFPRLLRTRPVSVDDEFLVVLHSNDSTALDRKRGENNQTMGYLLESYETQSGNKLWSREIHNYYFKMANSGSCYGDIHGSILDCYNKDSKTLFAIVDNFWVPDQPRTNTEDVEFKAIAIDARNGDVLWEAPLVSSFIAITKGMLWGLHMDYENTYPHRYKKKMLVGIRMDTGEETYRKKIGNSATVHELTNGRLLIRESRKINCYG